MTGIIALPVVPLHASDCKLGEMVYQLLFSEGEEILETITRSL